MIDQPLSPISSDSVTRTLLDEIYKALGLRSNFKLRAVSDFFLRIPIQRFGMICFGLNERIASEGLAKAAQWTLNQLVDQVSYHGLDKIPPCGPLLVVSNHPGATDSVCITAGLGRDDLKIIVSEVPFYRTLPEISKHFIYTTKDQHTRMASFRDSLRHLKNGGALLLFATGRIDPDPHVMPGAEEELEAWSESINFFFQMMPDLPVVISLTSGVVSSRYASHPITRLRKKTIDKRRLAEFLQILVQMVSGSKMKLRPYVTFSPPYVLNDLMDSYPGQKPVQAIINEAKSLIKNHLSTKSVENS
jgi:1-acyl-sn-glycerol-3-phosphate acyltransferase